jgi:hypothetical protein
MWPWPKNALSEDREDPSSAEDSKNWRQLQLLRAGFAPAQAAALASERAIDLHALIELVERGCPTELAARILEPFDHEKTAC